MYYSEPIFLLKSIFTFGLQISSLSFLYLGEKSRWLYGVYNEQESATLINFDEESLNKRKTVLQTREHRGNFIKCKPKAIYEQDLSACNMKLTCVCY